MAADNERMEKIVAPIDRANPAEHEAALRRRLQEVQLMFADERHRRERAAGSTRPFSEVLEDYSGFLGDLREAYSLAARMLSEQDVSTSDSPVNVEAATERYMGEVKARIDEIHEKGGNRQDEMAEYLGNEWERFKYEDRPIEKPESIGLLRFNVSHDTEGLERYDISPEDEVLEIHVDAAFASDSPMSAMLSTMRDSFSKLATTIVDRYPRAKAVVGTSWLISHPAAKRFGFRKVEEREVPQNRPGTWYQMIDKDGQVNARRLKSMLETGELPYEAAFGLIPIEDFLRRYLPPERRGKIVLQELSPEWIGRRRKIAAEGAALRADWPKLSVADIENDGFFDRIPTLSEVMEAIGEKERFRQAFKEAKSQGRDTLMNFGGESEYADMIGRMNAELESGKYVERIIEIP